MTATWALAGIVFVDPLDDGHTAGQRPIEQVAAVPRLETHAGCRAAGSGLPPRFPGGRASAIFFQKAAPASYPPSPYLFTPAKDWAFQA